MVDLVGKLGKAALRKLEEQRMFQEALSIVEDMFKPYAGAKPKVPQQAFPRVPTGKQGIDPALLRAIESKPVKEQMLEGMQRGMPLKDWYNMEPTRLLWGDITGNQAVGTQRFNRLQDFMGPTSILSEVDPNIGNASRWNYYEMNKLPPEEQLAVIQELNKKGVMADKEKLIPPPPSKYGGAGQINQFKLATELLRTGQPQDPLKYLKTSRYGGALKGNVANVPVDRHAVRAPLMLLGDPGGLETSVKLGKGIPTFNAQQRYQDLMSGGKINSIAELSPTWWRDAPTNAAEYYAMEDYFKMLSAEVGLPPAEGQATAWVGHAPLTGVETDPTLGAQQLFNRRVAGQSVLRNMDPRDLLTRVMTGDKYLGLGGAGIGAGMAGSQLLPGGSMRDGAT